MKSYRSHFANWREWELNPIVIKELRQAVRSWAVTGMLLLFLTVLFITSLIFLVNQSFEADANMALGGSMFTVFMVILAVASIFFIPLYVGIRVAVERQENNLDLLYVSTLTPARIIGGKILCGAYMALLFFSACMPFMAFTNLLRGVDLPTVFFILFYLFLVVCAVNMIAIFLACLPMSRPFKVLLALIGFIASFWVVIPLLLFSFEFLRSGVGSMMSKPDFWFGTLTSIGIGLAGTGLFFVLAVALISPPSSNRALGTRLYLTLIWLLGGLLSFGWVVRTGEAGRMLIWTYTTFVVMIFALLVTVSNSDEISSRVRRTIPQSATKRSLAFLFYNGAAGGLIWVAAILIATYGVTKGVIVLFPRSLSSPETGRHWYAATSAYAFAYALMALFIHRTFLSKRPPKIAGVLAVLLAGAWAIVPTILLFFINQLSWKSVEGLQLGNIFNVVSLRDEEKEFYHTYFAFGWLLVMMVINAKWFLRQVKSFQPLAPPVPKAAPPVVN